MFWNWKATLQSLQTILKFLMQLNTEVLNISGFLLDLQLDLLKRFFLETFVT